MLSLIFVLLKILSNHALKSVPKDWQTNGLVSRSFWSNRCPVGLFGSTKPLAWLVLATRVVLSRPSKKLQSKEQTDLSVLAQQAHATRHEGTEATTPIGPWRVGICPKFECCDRIGSKQITAAKWTIPRSCQSFPSWFRRFLHGFVHDQKHPKKPLPPWHRMAFLPDRWRSCSWHQGIFNFPPHMRRIQQRQLG